MKTKQIYKYLHSLLINKKKQLGYARSLEAKFFLEGQIMLLEQIKRDIIESVILQFCNKDLIKLGCR